MKLIGKGAFTKCYQLNSRQVLLKTIDPLKEAIALGFCGNSKLLPKLTRIETSKYASEYAEFDYIAPLYAKLIAPSKQLIPKHLAYYKTLCSIEHIQGGRLDKAINDIKDKYLRETMVSYFNGCANYGYEHLTLEVTRRNLAVTPSGRLILLDIFFLHNLL